MSTKIKIYRNAEKTLQEFQTILKQFIEDGIDVTNEDAVKRLEFLAGAVLSRQKYAEIVWNYLTDTQMDKIIAERKEVVVK